MQADTLSTIYTLLSDNKAGSPTPSLKTELYNILPTIAVIDPSNYVSHHEHLERLMKHIESLLTHAATSKISIGIGGGFSTGKSRFINTLLNVDILPEAIEPCTAVATYLTHRESSYTEALNIFDSIINIEQHQLKQLRHFIGDDSENALHISQLIKHITIRSKKIKWQNLSFLDTPGYSKADAKNSIVNDENLALTQLSSVDHIVWLVSAKNGMIREDDIKFLHQIDHHNPVFLVITQADLVNQEDILPIMEGIQQHLEKNNIAIAGLMAWAAPAYEFEGKKVAGDDIKIWLKKLNNEEHDTYLSEFIDCCQDLIRLSSDRVLKLIQDNDKSNVYPVYKDSLISDSESEKLIETLKTEQEKIRSFMDKVVNLTKNHSAFDWGLANLYESNQLEGSITDAIDIYHKQAKNNTDKAIKKLNKIVVSQKNIEAIIVLADIYEKLLDDIEHSAEYHILLLNSQPNTQQASKSWSWLFGHAIESTFVFEKLKSNVLDMGNSEQYYHFALVAETLNEHDLCMEFMIKSAEDFFYDALGYIKMKAENDNNDDLKIKLGNIYQSSSAINNQEMAISIYEDLAVAKSEEAIKCLDLIAKIKISLRAMNILAKIYVSENNVSKATKYNLLIVKHYPKSDTAIDSWNWLFENAEKNKKILIKLKNVIDQSGMIDASYRMANLLDGMGEINNATDYYLSVIGCEMNSVNKENIWNWLLNKAEKNKDILIKLENFIDKCDSVENLYKMAKFSEKINYVNKAVDYHCRIINVYSKSDVASYSWDWLFFNAKKNEDAFIGLRNVVDKSNSPNTNYRMAVSLEEIGNHDLATLYATKSTLANHPESEEWLLKRAKNIKHPARRKLLSLYAKHNYKKIKQEDIYPYFIENILIEDKEAFENLEYIAENSEEYKAVWLLSLCYQHGICVEKKYQKSYCCLKTAYEHIEEARYNLDVITYNDMRKKYPLTYEARLFINPLITDEPPLFADQGSLRYMFYLSLLTPEFISFNEKEPSYSINYMTWLMLVFLIIFLIF